MLGEGFQQFDTVLLHFGEEYIGFKIGIRNGGQDGPDRQDPVFITGHELGEGLVALDGVIVKHGPVPGGCLLDLELIHDLQQFRRGIGGFDRVHNDEALVVDNGVLDEVTAKTHVGINNLQNNAPLLLRVPPAGGNAGDSRR